jgi:hypothetical protein
MKTRFPITRCSWYPVVARMLFVVFCACTTVQAFEDQRALLRPNMKLLALTEGLHTGTFGLNLGFVHSGKTEGGADTALSAAKPKRGVSRVQAYWGAGVVFPSATESDSATTDESESGVSGLGVGPWLGIRTHWNLGPKAKGVVESRWLPARIDVYGETTESSLCSATLTASLSW